MNKLFVITLLVMLISGCAQQVFVMKKESVGTPTQTTTHHFFVSGIGQKKSIDVAAVCGGADRVARVESRLSFLDGLLKVITFGIYTPREASVYCTTETDK